MVKSAADQKLCSVDAGSVCLFVCTAVCAGVTVTH